MPFSALPTYLTHFFKKNPFVYTLYLRCHVGSKKREKKCYGVWGIVRLKVEDTESVVVCCGVWCVVKKKNECGVRIGGYSRMCREESGSDMDEAMALFLQCMWRALWCGGCCEHSLR